MTSPLALTRRSALLAAAGLGLNVTFLARQSFAASEGDLARRKMLVIICRGAADGLSVSPPIGDPDYAALRGVIAIRPDQALKIDDTFALHPKLTTVHALLQKGQARIAPAIATPDRARSHFEAQDVLESGGTVAYGVGSGWLNRAVEALRPIRRVEAISVGAQAPLILRGKVQAASWSPGGYNDKDQRLPSILTDLYAGDPLLAPALASGLETEAMAKAAVAAAARPRMIPASAPMASAPAAMAPAPGQTLSGGPTMGAMTPNAADAQAALAAQRRAQQAAGDAARNLGTTLAKFMTGQNGPQIAAISLDGFDTHANQGAAEGQLAGRLTYLDSVIDGLSTGLGGEWSNTMVLVATEFGRTARVNGTNGTDHGTASTAIVLGGGLKAGGIIGDWPGLQQAKLFENRDTAPTLDMRGLFKGALADHLGLDRTVLDRTVFPDSAAATPVTGLV